MPKSLVESVRGEAKRSIKGINFKGISMSSQNPRKTFLANNSMVA